MTPGYKLIDKMNFVFTYAIITSKFKLSYNVNSLIMFL